MGLAAHVLELLVEVLGERQRTDYPLMDKFEEALLQLRGLSAAEGLHTQPEANLHNRQLRNPSPVSATSGDSFTLTTL